MRKSCPEANKSCPDFTFVHSTNSTLSSKSGHDFDKSGHDFCREECFKTHSKSGHHFELLQPSNFESISTMSPNPSSEEAPIKFTQACFPHTDLDTRTSANLSVELASCGSIKKFTDASFFTYFAILPKYIDKNIPNKVMHVLEDKKLLTIKCILPKGIQACLTAIGHTSSRK